jgi:hypothetical protein
MDFSCAITCADKKAAAITALQANRIFRRENMWILQ